MFELWCKCVIYCISWALSVAFYRPNYQVANCWIELKNKKPYLRELGGGGGGQAPSGPLPSLTLPQLCPCFFNPIVSHAASKCFLSPCLTWVLHWGISQNQSFVYLIKNDGCCFYYLIFRLKLMLDIWTLNSGKPHLWIFQHEVVNCGQWSYY